MQSLRTALSEPGILALPGAFNGLCARMVADAGFGGCYVSGAAVTASFGVPDVGLVTLPEFCNVIEQVARASGLPVLADADTGFGEAEMVARTVHEYARAGAAGFHIEDQVFPKRCGHLDGKTLVPIDHFQEKVAWARTASDDATGGDFVVCARTDGAGVNGLDDAIVRAKAYLDAGADMIFPEGLRSEEDFGRVAQQLKAHKSDALLLANMTEFGKTPIINVERFEALGYDVVIWPVSTLRSAMGGVGRLLETFKQTGEVTDALGDMLDREGLYRLLGYTPGTPWAYPSSTR
ncbi:MAG: methylisocitrate lyase [Phycisphaerales bacterium]